MNLELDSRRNFLKQISAGALYYSLSGLLVPSTAFAKIKYEDALSPRNSRRELRPHTKYIILHTTEASDSSSENMVRRFGLANYLLHTNGTIQRIIDKNKVARHAGRSIWEGHSNIDDWGIGIEVVGYHDKSITSSQINSLRHLISSLQDIYNVPDKNVIPHSMVAYGSPNQYHHYNHRGRKRCGMFFALPEVRKKLGLNSAPSIDKEVASGRLKVADPFLESVLFSSQNKKLESLVSLSAEKKRKVGNIVTSNYSPWTIAHDSYNSRSTMYQFPNGSVISGDKIEDWGKIPVGTKVTLNAIVDSTPDDLEVLQKISGSDTAWSIAGKQYDSEHTIYFLPDGRVRTGKELDSSILNNLPRGTEVLTGYIYGGKVTLDRNVSKIAGKSWNSPSTFYRLPDRKLVSGDDIDSRNIPQDTIVFFRNGI